MAMARRSAKQRGASLHGIHDEPSKAKTMRQVLSILSLVVTIAQQGYPFCRTPTEKG